MRFLLLPHRFPPRGTGGVETWAWNLAGALARAGHAVHVLSRDESPGRELPPFTCVDGATGEAPAGVAVSWIRHRHGDARCASDAWQDPRFAAPLEKVFRSFAPDCVHVGHPDGWGVVPFRVAEQLGLPVGATLHDYKWLCGRGQMIQADGTLCEAPLEEACARCLRDQLGARAARGLLRRWLGPAAAGLAARRDGRPLLERGEPGERVRRRWHARQRAMLGALRSAALVTAPSEFVARVHRDAGLEGPITVQRNGTSGHVARPERASGPLRVGFFGTSVPTKGLEFLLRVARSLPPDLVELRVHGPPPRPPEPAIEFRGPYPRGEALARMAEVDVVALPSSWHENAPMVAAEARAAGCLLLVSDRGGLPELVRPGVDGWVEPADDLAAWRGRLTDLGTNPAGLAPLLAAVQPPLDSDAVARAFAEAWAAALAG